jgi:hypothetical protein
MLGASIPASKPQPIFTAAELLVLFLFFIFQISKLRERATALSRLKESIQARANTARAANHD